MRVPADDALDRPFQVAVAGVRDLLGLRDGGKRTGQIALHFGADDWGGTLLEENIKAAAFVNTIGVDEIVTLIRDAGFTPAQRTTEYEILKRY